jgi:hypothetical protein
MGGIVRRFSLVVGALLLVGCSEGLAPVPMAEPVSQSEQLSHAMAMTMGNAQMAEIVRDYLRQSPYVRHKVSLQEFLSHPASEPFVADLAANLDRTPTELLQSLAEQPALDFWMPSRTHRRTWEATPDVIVVSQLSGEPIPALAYGSDRRSYPARRFAEKNSMSVGTAAVFFIAPSNGLGRRLNPQPAIAGAVVQDENDGEFGGLVTQVMNNGDSVITQLADMLELSLGGDAALVGDAPGVTYLNRLWVIGGEDNMEFNPTLELKFRTELRRQSNGSVVRYTQTAIDAPSNFFAGYQNFQLLNAVLSPTGYLFLKVREDDGWWASDNYGDFVINSSAANYINSSASLPYFFGGPLRCGGVYGDFGYVPCPGEAPASSAALWRVVNLDVRWLPYEAPPPYVYPPEVSGPATVAPGIQNTWSVVNLAGNAMPYEYFWYVDGVQVGTGETLTMSLDNPASYSTVSVEVLDQGTYWVDASKSVYVNTGMCNPQDPGCFEYTRAPVEPLKVRRPARLPWN